MDFVWKTALRPSKIQPLVLANKLRAQIKTVPGELTRFCVQNARRIVRKTVRTSPAVLIGKVYEPLKVYPVETAVKCLRKRVPFVEDVWGRLQVTPEEWYAYFQNVVGANGNRHEDVDLPPSELVQKYGYPVEVYKDIETEDGYLLEMFRIPHGRANKDEKDKPVAFLMHGLLSSSADYVLTGPQRGLALLLADRGYDVWVGNSRGTCYSRKHKKYDADTDAEYWKFSFHEIGVYDLPAMIDLALATTKRETLSYIGTSQGTTAFFVLASEKPEYNKRIQVMASLAPAAFCSNISSPLIKLGIHLHGIFLPVAAKVGLVEFPPKHLKSAISYLNKKAHSEGICQDVVTQLLFMLVGHSSDQLNRKDLPMILSHVPHPASIYQVHHFAQNAATGTFRKFDYGPEGNLEKYGAQEPPSYDLSKISSPVALYYSSGDYLSQPKDVLRLHDELPNCICLHKIENEQFNHIDFVYGADVVELLYNHVFETLKKYAH